MSQPLAKSPWRPYVLLAVVPLIVIGAMSFVLETGSRMSVRHSPMVDAAVQIQLAGTTAHLWFEEILSGDRSESMTDVWRHLDRADWYADAMLEGDHEAGVTYVPLDDPATRRKIQEVRRKLGEFRDITEERWESQRMSVAGTGIDQRYDDVFREFVALAGDVEAEVLDSIRRDNTLFRRVQISLIVAAAVLSALAGWLFARYLRQREVAERRLARSEAQLRLTFESTPIPVVVMDASGRFVGANPACCRLLGHSESELLTLSLRDITHPDDLDRGGDLFEALQASEGSEIRIERRYLRKDGTVLHGVIHSGRIPEGEARSAAIVGQIIDRTEQVEAEQEARRLRDRLTHVTRVSMMGEMATGIAHEINQPLTAIAATAQACRRLVEGRRVESSELLEALDQVARQALRAGEVISRLRSHVIDRESRREFVAVNDVIRDVVKLGDVDVRLRGFVSRVDLADDLPEVAVDVVQIQQVLLNLVRNGVEAMEGVAGRGEAIAVVSRRSDDGDGIEIRVVDRGRGISDEAARRLFQPFFTTKDAGLGMGLSISRSIVTSHGGRMWHSRNLDRGTTFHVVLPASVEGGHGTH